MGDSLRRLDVDVCLNKHKKVFPLTRRELRGQLRCYRIRKTALPPREFLEESKSSHKDRKKEFDGEREEVKEGRMSQKRFALYGTGQ